MSEPAQDNVLRPIDLERIAGILDAEGVEYVQETALDSAGENPRPVVRTGFVECSIVFYLDGDMVKVDAQWRGRPAATAAPQALAAVNEWNLTQLIPQLYFMEVAEGIIGFACHRSLNCTGGVSHNQVGAFVMTTIQAVMRCCGYLDQQFPSAVTWNPAPNDGAAPDGISKEDPSER